jgi:hypothetical protein
MTAIAVPTSLVYELSDGQPIYYKNYKNVLNGLCSIDEIMGCGSIQSLVISLLLKYLSRNIDETVYSFFTNEIGLIGSKLNRACDIAVYENKRLKATFITKNT